MLLPYFIHFFLHHNRKGFFPQNNSNAFGRFYHLFYRFLLVSDFEFSWKKILAIEQTCTQNIQGRTVVLLRFSTWKVDKPIKIENTAI